MPIKLVGGHDNSNSGYRVTAVGDGSSTTFSVDLYDQIAADMQVHDKNPTGVFQVNSNTESPVPSASLSGTTVTFTWGTAPSNGALIEIGVVLTF